MEQPCAEQNQLLLKLASTVPTIEASIYVNRLPTDLECLDRRIAKFELPAAEPAADCAKYGTVLDGGGHHKRRV